VTKPQPETYEIFNRHKTIGISVVREGTIKGIFLDESVRKMNERDLARDILAVASVAAMRGRLAIREYLEAEAAAAGRTVPPQTYEAEAMRNVPTHEQYEHFKQAKLK
jgi:hypothetical protein